jgi:uncharacterized protein (TIGR02145 family)
MSRLARILFLVLFLAPIFSKAQLREFEITPAMASGTIPVFRDYPNNVAIIIRSSLTNLRFESNLGITADRSDPSKGEYVLILDPVRQSLTVNAPGYQQGRIQVSLTEARQVAYYKVDPKDVVLSTFPVTIRVTPADANVIINDQSADLSKPVPLEPGTHAVRIEKQGFRTLEREIRVNESSLLFELALTAIEPVPVTIRTQPPGASVLLDGVQVGVTDRTGALGLFRFPGSYELSVQLSGYVGDVRMIVVSEAGPNTVSSTLVRNAGTLLLSVTPNDAIVLVNRQGTDVNQPLELAPGMVRIEVSKDGHEPFAETVEIQRGETVNRSVTLVSHLGGIQITTVPFEAGWSLTAANGQVSASGTGLARKTGIPVGSYRLSVRAAGYQDHSETVQVVRDQILEKSIALREGPPQCGTTVSDIDENIYKTVQIGTQCWMAENLRTSNYRDGTPIPHVTQNSQWGNLTTGAWVHYENQAVNDTRYGKLYNWYVVADLRNACPVGWHVPSDAEWTNLSSYVGRDPGYKIKSTTDWSSIAKGSNSSGFSGLPGGYRDPAGTYYDIGKFASFWSSTESNTFDSWSRNLNTASRSLFRVSNYKSNGFSVRCIQD